MNTHISFALASSGGFEEGQKNSLNPLKGIYKSYTKRCKKLTPFICYSNISTYFFMYVLYIYQPKIFCNRFFALKIPIQTWCKTFQIIPFYQIFYSGVYVWVVIYLSKYNHTILVYISCFCNIGFITPYI